MKQFLRSAAIMSALALSSGPALAYEVATGKVTDVEVSWLPTLAAFQFAIDQGGTSCASGFYEFVGPYGGPATPEATQAVNDAAMLSKLLGQSVTVYTVGCSVYFFHVGY